MQASYVMATGDKSQLTQYYKVFRDWTIFLEGEALYPRDQVSSDDFQGVGDKAIASIHLAELCAHRPSEHH